jgi:hypothetical protein
VAVGGEHEPEQPVSRGDVGLGGLLDAVVVLHVGEPGGVELPPGRSVDGEGAAFQTIRSPLYTQESGQKARPYRVPVEEKQLIRGMLFEGFRKGLFSPVKFDSDSERRFSVVLENDGDVLKWFKPAKGVFQIRYK